MSSPSPNRSSHGAALASSSRKLPNAPDEHSDEELELQEDELLAEDPLHGSSTANAGFGFARRQRSQQQSSLVSRLIPLAFNGRIETASPKPDSPDVDTPSTPQSDLNGAAHPNGTRKDAGGSDWYIEGQGRRVGYDDHTTIDWIYEYNKERTRLRNLFAIHPGAFGQVKLFMDASHMWLVLVATGIAVGGIAAAIDVASNWLGDIKTGICSNVDSGGRFYLDRAFCCWGASSFAECHDWRTWSTVLGFTGSGASYIIEYIYFVLFSVAFAGAASVLVTKYSLYAKQSGIPEIKTVLGGFVIHRFLGSWTLVAKSLGLCLTVASGMWLGKEGPLVHVACCCANVFMKLFPALHKNEARKRETLSAAAASGISVAFASPIGGVLFSLESLSSYFPDKTMWASFVCAMIAAVTLQAFDPFRTGNLVLYQVTYYSGWHAFEIVPFVIIGIGGGLYGALFIRLNMAVAAWRKSKRNPFLKRPILEVIAVAALTALISFPITFMRAQSSQLVEYLFAECRDIDDDFLGLCKQGIANTGVILILLVSACFGFILATITFGLQIPSGLLLPSMAIGALYGRVVGLTMEVWQTSHPTFIAFRACEPDIPCITPGTYAVIGAASALAGVTRMTVSIVVIMFELTGALTYVLPIMIAVMTSKLLGDAFGKQGIYESWINFNGYPFLDNKDDTPVPDISANQVMTRVDDLVCITATGYTIESLRSLLKQHKYRGFPVIADDSDYILLGYISRLELSYALDAATSERKLPDTSDCFFSHQPSADPSITLDLRPWMNQTPFSLAARTSLQLTNEMFQKLGLRYLVFTDRGSLMGLMTKKDLWTILTDSEDDRGRYSSREPREEPSDAFDHHDDRADEQGLLGDRRRDEGDHSRNMDDRDFVD